MNVLRNFVDQYLVQEVKEEPVSKVTVKNEPAAEAVPVVDESRCLNPGCKKKGKWDCIHKFCFPCCAAAKEANPEDCENCTGHYAIYRKIQEENRLIEMGLSANSKGKTKFYHFEEKFMNHGETVVIWCLRDFCNNPSFSNETFEQYKRLERSRNLLLKLGKVDDTEEGTSTTDDKTSMSSPTRGLKRSVNDSSSSTLNSPMVRSPTTNKRGRGSKVIESESSSTLATLTTDSPAVASEDSSPRKRGRPPRVTPQSELVEG